MNMRGALRVIRDHRGMKYKLARMSTDELVNVLDNACRQHSELSQFIDVVDQELMQRTMAPLVDL
jgi:hypothetical protein